MTRILRNPPVTDTPFQLDRAARRGVVVPAPAPADAPGTDGFDAGFAQGVQEGMARVQADVARLRASLQDEGRRARQDGFDQGHAEGLARAREQAMAEMAQAREALEQQAAQALRQRLDELNALAQALQAQAGPLLVQAEDDLVALAHDAVCKVLASRAVEPEVVAAMVRNLVAQHDLAAPLALHVHPADAQALAQGTNAHARWTWIPDEQVTMGGVLIRTGTGTLDARLESQVQALGRALTRARNERSRAPEQLQ